MTDRERRIKYVLSILEADPVVSEKRIADMCRVSVPTIKGDLKHIEQNAGKSKTKRLIEMRKIGLKRVKHEELAMERKEEGYVIEYDLLEFLRKGGGVGKTRRELAELLSVEMEQKVEGGKYTGLSLGLLKQERMRRIRSGRQYGAHSLGMGTHYGKNPTGGMIGEINIQNWWKGRVDKTLVGGMYEN